MNWRNKKRKGKRSRWSKKCSATRKETDIQDTTKTTGTNESGETEVEKSACELDDRETSSSSAKKIKIIITHLDEQKHRAQVDNHESMQEYVLHFVNWVKDFPQ